MLKNYIYLTIIALIVISCSKPNIIGNWRVSQETLFDGIENSVGMNQYYEKEMKEKLASKIAENTTYSFLDNGTLNIQTLSVSDSVEYNLSGSWKTLDSEHVEIIGPDKIAKKYKFKIDNNFLILENLSDASVKFILEKK